MVFLRWPMYKHTRAGVSMLYTIVLMLHLFTPKCLVRIVCVLPSEIPTLLAISSTVNRPSSTTSALTTDTFFLVIDVFGWPGYTSLKFVNISANCHMIPWKTNKYHSVHYKFILVIYIKQHGIYTRISIYLALYNIHWWANELHSVYY